jgi:uncharacterized protein with NAD-binding domain and iron-sulfur cluster
MVRSILRLAIRTLQTLDELLYGPPPQPAPTPTPRPAPRPGPSPKDITGKRKVAVLGGGVGAMTTAYELSKTPELRSKYEVTVYQLGWRLGGKGASGRNPAMGDRIEEHGLHIWMGHYENAFAMIRDVYGHLGRPEGAPLATWRDAFTRHDYIVLGESPEQTGEGWLLWPFDFPENGAEPGLGGLLPGPFAYVQDLLGVLRKLLSRLPGLPRLPESDAPDYPDWVDEELARARREAAEEGRVGDEIDAPSVHPALRSIVDAHQHSLCLRPDPAEHRAVSHTALVHLVEVTRETVRGMESAPGEADGATTLRRFKLLVELYSAVVRGILVDGVVLGGFDVLDRWDLREWLANHGARPELTRSAAAAAMYGLMFAYVKGDPQNQQIAAGVAVRFALRMTLAYKGAIFWKMNAGMGDTIFAPIYEVLKARGVRFKFFHRVDRLDLDATGELVDRINLTEQAHVKNGADYRPLIDVKDLPCWPSEPLYDQLVEGEELRRKKVCLESSWSDWTGGTSVSLQRGRDFDDVVLATSIGPLPQIAPEILRRHPRWAEAVRSVATNQTFSVQLWLSPTLSGLGWTADPPAMTTYAERLNTWADMAHLLPRETWPEGQVQDIAYFTAPFPDAETIPPFTDHGFPERMLLELQKSALTWLPQNIAPLWPKARGARGDGFDWGLLYDPNTAAVGPARFASQFCKINIDPSERYVLSLPNATEARLDPERDRQVKNLYPSGDWTRTGLNCGAVESAVMGGMKAARALSGSPRHIVGE